MFFLSFILILMVLAAVFAKKMILGTVLIVSVMGMMAGTFLLLSPAPQKVAQVYLQTAMIADEEQAYALLKTALAFDPYNSVLWQTLEQIKQKQASIAAQVSSIQTNNQAIITP